VAVFPWAWSNWVKIHGLLSKPVTQKALALPRVWPTWPTTAASLSWKRIKHPSEIVNVGDEIDVKVLKYDRERNRVSLGLKQLGEDDPKKK
jgi:polyribonucleotide nucleotidyltransferase